MEKINYVSKLIFYSKLCASDKHTWNSTKNDDPKTPEKFTIMHVFREAQTFLEQSSQFQTLHFSSKEKKKST